MEKKASNREKGKGSVSDNESDKEFYYYDHLEKRRWGILFMFSFFRFFKELYSE